MCKRIFTCGMAILALAAGATAKAAEDSGLYIGASVGEATIRNSEIDFEADDTAFKLFGGYAFNKYFAVEAAYIDTGTAEDKLGNLIVQFESTGVIASLVGSIPVSEHFSFFGKLGYAFYETEQFVRQGNLSDSDSESDEDLAYSAGAELHFGRFTVRAEFESADVDGSFDAVFVSALFKF